MMTLVSDPAPSASSIRPSPTPSRLAVFGRRLSTTLVLWAAMVTFIAFESGLLCFVVVALFSLASLWEVSRLLPTAPGWNELRRWTMGVAIAYLGATAWWIVRHDTSPPFGLDAAAIVVLSRALSGSVIGTSSKGGKRCSGCSSLSSASFTPCCSSPA